MRFVYSTLVVLAAPIVAAAAPAAAMAAAPVPFPIPGEATVAYKLNCTTNCPLLIMLHGAGGDGEKMAGDSQMHYKFEGIIAYPSCIPFATGWPIYVR